MSIENVRALAQKSVAACRKGGKYANLEVKSTLERVSFEAPDRALYTAIVYGAVERRITLDYIISKFASRPPERIDNDTLSACEIGIYQLLYLDRVPAHAAVNETVASAPKRSRDFVNAVLRSFIRAGKKYDLPKSRLARLSVEYSCPQNLVLFFEQNYPDRADKLLEKTLCRPPMCLRVNTLKISASDALVKLGTDARISPIVSDVIEYSGDASPAMEGIDKGLWFVEDASSRSAVSVLGARPGERIIDCCAAPGGKSFSAAIDMENSGEIFSFDLHENKLSLIRSGAQKLGINIIEAARVDAKIPRTELFSTADRVLCDAPCSGLGVIAKKPDIKYKVLDDVARLPQTQFEILKQCANYVKPGGTLVYSTCTLNPDENEAVFKKFLIGRDDFAPSDFELAGASSSGGYFTFLPDVFPCDGFFVARAIRRI